MTDRIINLTKAAAVSLRKNGIDDGLRAAVYLVLDHSGSMADYYARGDVQRLTEQALGLSANLDDDQVVPLTYFGSIVSPTTMVRIGDHDQIIDRTHPNIAWGSTNYAAAINAIADDHMAETAGNIPGLVIFQTDGAPDSRPAAEKALKDAAELPLFFAFVGFGRDVDYLKTLTAPRAGGLFRKEKPANASFFHAPRPHDVPDADLYDGITAGFAQWLTTRGKG